MSARGGRGIKYASIAVGVGGRPGRTARAAPGTLCTLYATDCSCRCCFSNIPHVSALLLLTWFSTLTQATLPDYAALLVS